MKTNCVVLCETLIAIAESLVDEVKTLGQQA